VTHAPPPVLFDVGDDDEPDETDDPSALQDEFPSPLIVIYFNIDIFFCKFFFYKYDF
jgi:hypothetical protein